jgi:hypothetical protein
MGSRLLLQRLLHPFLRFGVVVLYATKGYAHVFREHGVRTLEGYHSYCDKCLLLLKVLRLSCFFVTQKQREGECEAPSAVAAAAAAASHSSVTRKGGDQL